MAIRKTRTCSVVAYFAFIALGPFVGACNKRPDTSPSETPSSAAQTQYAGETPEKLGPHEIPRSWNFAEFEEQPPRIPGKLRVLAWAVEDYDRGFCTERCIIIRELDEDDGFGRWHASHIYRDPRGKDSKWRESMMHALDDDFVGSWYMHYKRFTERPGNKAMYAAMDSYKELYWSFKAEGDAKFVSCGVCEKAWEEVMGEKPTRFFKK